MRRALIVAAAAVALVVIAFFVAVPIVLDRNLSVEALAERASEATGRKVTLDDVGIAFVPGLRIRAENVEVEGAASAKAVEVEIAVLPLLRRRVEPAELHLIGARLLLERGQDGRLRARLLHPPGGEAREGGGLPALPALEASDGELVVVDAAGRPTGAPTLRIVRFEQGRLAEGDRVPVRLDVALDPGTEHRWAAGELRIEGELERGEGELNLRAGRARGRDLVLRGLRFERVDGRFDYADGGAAIESLTLDGYGGRVELAGTLRAGNPARYGGRLTVSGLTVSDAIAHWGARPFEHPLAPFDASGDVDVWLRRAGSGTGRGDFALHGGEMPAGSLFSAVLGTIGKITGRVLSLGRRSPVRSQIERASASWTLHDDRLHTDALVLVTDDYRFGGAGSVGLDSTLALTGDVAFTSQGAQRLLASASLPLPGADAVIPAIPVEVGGRLGDPDFTSSATGLPSATASALAGLVRGGGGVVKGVAEGGKGVVKGTAKGGKRIVDKVLGR